MTKKIRLTTIFIIAIILACSISSLIVVKGQQIDSVEEVEMSENTAASISIKWDSVKRADGYRIYVENSKTNEYELYKELEGGDITAFTFENLKGAAVYNIKVNAFKYFRNNIYESEEATQLLIYSQPEKAVQTPYSDTEGILSIEWANQQNASGYELEYSKNEDFKDAEDVTIDDSKVTLFKVEGLTPKDVYYTRVRSYADIDGSRLYGEWSDAVNVTIKEKVVMPDNIDPKKPMVALSFDDGPAYNDGENGNSTSKILDVLEEYGARATFFMCASRIGDSNEQLLKRELSLGCELGNHTYDHTHYGKKVTAGDIDNCSNTIKDRCGSAPTIFRCPGGIITKEIQNECKRRGMPIAYWSVDTSDWKSKDPKKIYDIAINQAYDGAIILMHDIYPTTAEAVKKIVPKLIEDGYQVVGVSEMLMAKNGGEAPKAGEQYIDYETINNNTR